VRELVHDWSPSSPELIEKMIVTAPKIARDQLSGADLKLINRSVKEMRYAAKVFAPLQRFRKSCCVRFGPHLAQRAGV
jgi:hypothetical protein